LTAGGADNTPGEIVFTVNAPSQTQGSFIIEPRITDNGSGPVTVVKVGPGSMKIDGNNTFSGGLFILQGRLQFAGSEIGGRNPDGGGTGPIYILPGGQLFPSGATDAATPRITNQLFIAGLGGSAFSSGCIRLSGGNTPPVQELSGEITLIGDTFISGGAIPGGVPGTNSSISGRIRGPFSFGVGQSGGGEGFDTCYLLRNSGNDWSGNTVISSRNSGSRAYLRLGNNEVIPDGLGKGNVIFAPQSGNGVTALDLNGYNETVNGISISTAVPQQAFIENREAGTTSVLTVGNNDASSSFAGIIQNGASGAGVVALTKIGRGKLTLTGFNTYTGVTTVNDGTLALSASGSISNSGQILINGGTLDVSELSSGFTHGFPIDLTNGTFIIRNTTTPGLASLSMADSRIRVVSLGATPVVVETSSLITGGSMNVFDIGSVGTVASYPAQFTIIKYTSFGGAGFNFALGNVPTPSTEG
jgi:autotransporter-associated beta strand protein